MTVYVKLEPPFEWVKVVQGQVEGFGQVSALSDYPLDAEESVVGVVPGGAVTSYTVNVPAKTRKQFNQALPYVLEELISDEIDTIHCVCPNWRADTDVSVYCVAKERLQHWSRAAKENGIPATKLIPDYACLPEHSVADYVLSVLDDTVTIRHKEGNGWVLQKDYLDLWLQEVPNESVLAINDEALVAKIIASQNARDARYWPFGERMAHWLEHGIAAPIDLWTDALRPPAKSSQWSIFAWPIAITAASVIVSVGYLAITYFSLHREIQLITQESQALVKQIVPELDYVEPGKEREIAEQVLSRRAAGDVRFSLPSVLSAVAPILASQRVTLKEITLRDDELLLHTYLLNLGQADQIRQRLNQNRAFAVRLQGTSTDNELIVGTYSVRPAGGAVKWQVWE